MVLSDLLFQNVSVNDSGPVQAEMERDMDALILKLTSAGWKGRRKGEKEEGKKGGKSDQAHFLCLHGTLKCPHAFTLRLGTIHPLDEETKAWCLLHTTAEPSQQDLEGLKQRLMTFPSRS
jgi:hypothetical protein